MSAEKDLARAYWAACDAGEDVSAFFAEQFLWEGPQPVPDAGDAKALQEQWVRPWHAAFPEAKRSYHILCAGRSSGKADGSADGRMWVGATGYLTGFQRSAFYGIPTTDRLLRIRWGEFLCIENGQIVEVQCLPDFMDWFEQIGRPVMPPYQGAAHVWPVPTAFDGVVQGAVEAETAQTLALGRALLFEGLNVFDEAKLESMGIARFFHPNIKWYGPGGIGACLSLQEFEDFHQGPWLKSFPNRKVQDLASLFAEGRLLAASGTAGVKGFHTGAPFRGSNAAQGQEVNFSGIDFWLRTGDVFTENWVFVDFIKLFRDLGIDLMDRVGQT
ncbi:MAG: hypothetical protein AAGD04_05165 [Pseudomonadota bacterium]